MLGILIGLYFKTSIVFLSATILVASIIIYLFTKRIIYIVLLIIFLFGSVYVKILDLNYENKYKDINDKVIIKAVIITDAQEKDYKNTYTIKVKEIDGDNKYANTKLIFDFKKKDMLKEIPKYGDEIEIIGEIEKADSARNYKGFDYKSYLKSKNIYGIIQTDKFKILDINKTSIIERYLNLIQNNIKNNMFKVLESEEAALCIGILIGAREDISEEVEKDFKMSNLTHMLAVSGSHITYIISASSLLLGRTSKRFTKIFTIIFLIFFMALTGFTASVIRASIMGILILLSSLLYRKSDTINNLGISSIIILIFNPYTITDLGFLLSYAGTIGIVFFGNSTTKVIYNFINKMTNGKINFELDNNSEIQENCASLSNEILKGNKGVKRKKLVYIIIKYIVNALSITFSANILIIPIMAYSFSTISFTFWISNILAGPVMEIVTIFGFLVYFISIIFNPLAEFLGIFLNLLLSILKKIASFSSIIPGSSIYIKTPYLIECVIYFLIVFLWLNKEKVLNIEIGKNLLNRFKNNKYKIIATILIFIILTNIAVNLINRPLKIYFVDVGQGDCTLIETPTNKTILIDGGGSEFGSFDVGESTLLPYLLDRRVKTIDYMMISHFDSDHIGGLFAIMENLKVGNIIIAKQGKQSENLKKFQKIIAEKKINVVIVKKGDYIKIDKYSYFEILFPENNLINDNVLNNNSIVARFNCLNFRMLFVGDIEEIAENRMIELYKENRKLESTLLKVAHHGSKSSSIEEFLNIVKPKIALIGVGKDNKFGHPNEEVIKIIKKIGAKIYRTDLNGEIQIIVKNGQIKVDTMY